MSYKAYIKYYVIIIDHGLSGKDLQEQGIS
jgi:hypothetical protein